MARVIAGLGDQEAGAGAVRRSAGYEWGVLVSLGMAFAVVSFVDIALTFYPVNFGSREWQFGTATAVMNNLALGVLGIGFVAVAGLARDSRGLVGLAQVASGLLGLFVLVMAVLFVRNVGAALGSTTDPVILEGLREAIARTALQVVAYTAGLGWIIVRLRRA